MIDKIHWTQYFKHCRSHVVGEHFQPHGNVITDHELASTGNDIALFMGTIICKLPVWSSIIGALGEGWSRNTAPASCGVIASSSLAHMGGSLSWCSFVNSLSFVSIYSTFSPEDLYFLDEEQHEKNENDDFCFGFLFFTTPFSSCVSASTTTSG